MVNREKQLLFLSFLFLAEHPFWKWSKIDNGNNISLYKSIAYVKTGQKLILRKDTYEVLSKFEKTKPIWVNHKLA